MEVAPKKTPKKTQNKQKVEEGKKGGALEN